MKTERRRDARVQIDQDGTYQVVDESYGYSLRPGKQARMRATMVEWAAQFLAFSIGFATIAIIISPAGPGGKSFDVFEIGIAVIGFLVAGCFFSIGTRGTALELQVDRVKREYRTAYRNWRNHVKVAETYEMDQVRGVYVHATKGLSIGKMVFQMYADPDGLELIRADEKGQLPNTGDATA